MAKLLKILQKYDLLQYKKFWFYSLLFLFVSPAFIASFLESYSEFSVWIFFAGLILFFIVVKRWLKPFFGINQKSEDKGSVSEKSSLERFFKGLFYHKTNQSFWEEWSQDRRFRAKWSLLHLAYQLILACVFFVFLGCQTDFSNCPPSYESTWVYMLLGSLVFGICHFIVFKVTWILREHRVVILLNEWLQEKRFIQKWLVFYLVFFFAAIVISIYSLFWVIIALGTFPVAILHSAIFKISWHLRDKKTSKE